MKKILPVLFFILIFFCIYFVNAAESDIFYNLFNSSDAQYSSYLEMKNETTGGVSYASDSLDVGTTGVSCFSEKWIAPNWTGLTLINGTWNFTVYGYCSSAAVEAYLFAKVFKYNGTEYNFFNTTQSTNNFCLKVGSPGDSNNFYSNIPYSNFTNLSMGERVGVQFCLNITNPKNKFANLEWGNGSESRVIFPSETFAIDISPPQIDLFSPSDNLTTGATKLNFSFLTLDDSPPMNCSIYLDGSLNQTNSSVLNNVSTIFTIDNLLEGNHSWFVNCSDGGGYSNVSETRNFTIISDYPSSTITSPFYGFSIQDPTPQITFVLTDIVSSTLNYTIFVNGVANGQFGSVVNNTPTNLSIWPALELGSYNIVVQATDNDSNSVNSSVLQINIISPLVFMIWPEIDYWDRDGDINFTFYVEDPDPGHTILNCSLYLNGVLIKNNETTLNYTNTTFEVLGISEDVNQIWRVECIDPESAAGSDDRIFNVDKTSPSVFLNSPNSDNVTNLIDIYFNWTATDNLDSLLYCNLTIDGVVNRSNYMSPNNTAAYVNVFGLSSGLHYWDITCWDSANNVNTSETRNFTIVGPSCIYSGSGNWDVDCNDNCSITSNVDVLGNSISIIGTGTFMTTANITNFTSLYIAGTSSVNQCRVYCSGGGCFK